MSAPKGDVGEFWWHVHHDRLCEVLIETAETRRTYVRGNKPTDEVETRLRLFRPVRGTIEVPKYLSEAHAKRCGAYAKWREAGAKWREADAKWNEADAKWRASPSWKAVEALHAKECPNYPWNGETIFP